MLHLYPGTEQWPRYRHRGAGTTADAAVLLRSAWYSGVRHFVPATALAPLSPGLELHHSLRPSLQQNSVTTVLATDGICSRQRQFTRAFRTDILQSGRSGLRRAGRGDIQVRWDLKTFTRHDRRIPLVQRSTEALQLPRDCTQLEHWLYSSSHCLAN